MKFTIRILLCAYKPGKIRILITLGYTYFVVLLFISKKSLICCCVVVLASIITDLFCYILTWSFVFVKNMGVNMYLVNYDLEPITMIFKLNVLIFSAKFSFLLFLNMVASYSHSFSLIHVIIYLTNIWGSVMCLAWW